MELYTMKLDTQYFFSINRCNKNIILQVTTRNESDLTMMIGYSIKKKAALTNIVHRQTGLHLSIPQL